MSAAPIRNALTFDVEEYFQVSAFEDQIPREDWEKWPSRVAEATHRLLDLLADNEVKATFFTLGYVAENHPGLVRRIVADGHELGCHGMQHIRIFDQTRAEFRDDIATAKRILEDCSGAAVQGYRAASFSINRANFWAFEEIAEAGFRYSSSVYPVRHDLYGIPDAPRLPFSPNGSDPGFVEIPISTLRFAGRNYPIGGGGFFRLYPYVMSRSLIRRINHVEKKKVNMYFHPWEFDPEQPRPPGLSIKTKFRHYLNLGRSIERMKRLLRDFSWSTMSDVYGEELGLSVDGESHDGKLLD